MPSESMRRRKFRLSSSRSAIASYTCCSSLSVNWRGSKLYTTFVYSSFERSRRTVQRFTVGEQPARQCPVVSKWLRAPRNEQQAQIIVDDRQDHDDHRNERRFCGGQRSWHGTIAGPCVVPQTALRQRSRSNPQA